MISFQSLKVPASCSVELSLKGIEFLHNLFKKHDKDKDDCLSREELDDLFSVCPISLPWTRNNTAETDAKFQLTYCGYFSQWM
jgi:Ras family protein T1